MQTVDISLKKTLIEQGKVVKLKFYSVLFINSSLTRLTLSWGVGYVEHHILYIKK